MMARAPLTFRKRDLVRALTSAIAAGLKVAKVEIDKNGKIAVIIGEPLNMNGEAREIVL